jgi:hypothetical protein
MAERVCEEGTQVALFTQPVTQEPAGPDYTTWGQVWDDMRDETWYADSFRPGAGGRCHFPRIPDQVLEKAQALTDCWYDLGYHQTQEEDAPSVGDCAEPAPPEVPGVLDGLVEHVVLVAAPRHDPQALLGTMAPMNNWHEAGRSWCDSRHIFQRDRHAPATLVRRQHRLLRRQVHMALAQVA